MDTQHLLDHLVTATLVIDEQQQIHYANPAAEQLFYQNANRMHHSILSDLILSSSIDLSLLTQPLLTGQSITDSDVRLVLQHKPVHVEITSSPVSINSPEKKSPQLMLLIEIRTIEAQRRINQEQNQHAQQQAARVLVRGLAHEIKNPLGGLRGAAQLLERELPKPQLKEYTQTIIEQADRLRSLVDRLLGPQRPCRKSKHNVHQVLEKALQLIRLEFGAAIEIRRDYDPSLPEICIDADQIEQSFLNILHNAAQILLVDNIDKEKVITVRTRSVHQVTIHGNKHKLVAKIDVTDNGPGIPLEIQDTLFYPMVSGREGGTGLGLSIAQTIIDQHQGKIEVESWPGQTTMSFYLPLVVDSKIHL